MWAPQLESIIFHILKLYIKQVKENTKMGEYISSDGYSTNILECQNFY